SSVTGSSAEPMAAWARINNSRLTRSRAEGTAHWARGRGWYSGSVRPTGSYAQLLRIRRRRLPSRSAGLATGMMSHDGSLGISRRPPSCRSRDDEDHELPTHRLPGAHLRGPVSHLRLGAATHSSAPCQMRRRTLPGLATHRVSLQCGSEPERSARIESTECPMLRQIDTGFVGTR